MDERNDYRFRTKHNDVNFYYDSIGFVKNNFYTNIFESDNPNAKFQIDKCQLQRKIFEAETYYCKHNMLPDSIPSGLQVLDYEITDLGIKRLKSFAKRFEYARVNRGFMHKYDFNPEQLAAMEAERKKKMVIVRQRQAIRKAKTDKIPKYFPRIRE
ncbi:MAG: hypothetical protein K1X92_17930 [Bacteroidia bacterium]|nr:hypothetical protein [Bacteroidia bacterium]